MDDLRFEITVIFDGIYTFCIITFMKNVMKQWQYPPSTNLDDRYVAIR